MKSSDRIESPSRSGSFILHITWQEFWSNLPQNRMQPSPTPLMVHLKFDQDWPTGFRDIQVQKGEIFVTQGQVTPK